MTCGSPCIFSRLRVALMRATLQKCLLSRRSMTTTASISMECCRPVLKQGTDRARLLPTSKQAPYLKAIASVSDTRLLPFQDIECFHQARLVRVTHRRLAIWLNPIRVLDSQVVVNLFPQVGVCMDLVNHDH